MANKDPMRGKLRDPKDEAPEYLATKTSIIDGRQVNQGATVRYAGIPGKYLHPIDGKAKAVVAKVKEIAEGKDIDAKVQGDDRTRLVQAKLRAYSDELLGVTLKADGDQAEILRNAGVDKPDANQAELLKHAEATNKQTLENTREAGGVLVQLTGEQPSTMVPTTGPMAGATQDEKKSTAAKLADK